MTNTTTEKKALSAYFEAYPNASIRKLAAATGINYGILLKKSKEPVAGEAYDPDKINWIAVEQKLSAKGVDYTALDWDALNAERKRNGATLVKDLSAYEVGMHVYLRKNATVPYEIVYKTETHIVVMLEGTSEPHALSNNTFLLYGPSLNPREEKAEQ